MASLNIKTHLKDYCFVFCQHLCLNLFLDLRFFNSKRTVEPVATMSVKLPFKGELPRAV